jgi:hypothetical protein
MFCKQEVTGSNPVGSIELQDQRVYERT